MSYDCEIVIKTYYTEHTRKSELTQMVFKYFT